MEEADGVVRKESEEEYDEEQRFPLHIPYLTRFCLNESRRDVYGRWLRDSELFL